MSEKHWTLGYQRVSSVDQSLARQELGDVDRLFAEKVSGKTKDRPELDLMLSVLRPGDIVRVHSIDRLGRSMVDLMSIVECIRAKGASIIFISENLTFGPDSDDPIQTLQFQMMGAFAQFERALIEKRRLEGIARAKAEGRYKPGRPRVSIDATEALGMHRAGKSMRVIARHFNVSVSTVHGVLKRQALDTA